MNGCGARGVARLSERQTDVVPELPTADASAAPRTPAKQMPADGTSRGLADGPRSTDLHTHSTASDGTLSPVDLVTHAWHAGVPGLALTDHDTLAGIARARARAAELGLAFVSGVELSTGRAPLPDVHILAYCVESQHNQPLLQACDEMRAARRERAAEMVRQLEAAGAVITLESVLAHAGQAPVGRPHVARALVQAGCATGIKDAFQRWLVPGAPGYAPKQQPDPVDAVRLVRASGGVPVLAHPGTLHLSEAELERFLRQLLEAGLAGIEGYWARHDPATVHTCERLASRLGLVVTGGSDFHGENKPEIEIGRLAGGCILDASILPALEALACVGPARC